MTLETAAIVAIASLLSAAITLWFNRRKTNAEAAKTVTDAASTLLAHFEKRVTALTCRVEELERDRAADRAEMASLRNTVEHLTAYNTKLRNGVQILCAQLYGLQIQPEWLPEHWQDDRGR